MKKYLFASVSGKKKLWIKSKSSILPDNEIWSKSV